MKLVPITAVAVAGLCLAASTASAQYPAVVPHRGHYHVVPTYAPPVYGNQFYGNPGVSFGGVYASPRLSIGLNFGSGYGGGYSAPGFGGYGYGNPYGGFGGYGNGFGGHGGHHHHHHHHGHR